MGLNTHLGSFSYFKKVPRDPHGIISSILTSWFEKGWGSNPGQLALEQAGHMIPLGTIQVFRALEIYLVCFVLYLG